MLANTGRSLWASPYDLPLTAEMLSVIRPVTGHHPLRHAVFTHANGDHTHGGQLLPGSACVIGADGTAHGMRTEMASN